MPDPIFDRPLSVELLQWLARASLRQPDVLSMAIRLWAILRSLYGGKDDILYLDSLSNSFTYPEWRDRFFIDADTEHRADTIPTIHHPDCLCTKTITEWLFGPETEMSESQWLDSFDRHYRCSSAEIDRILNPVEWVYDPASGRSLNQWKQTLAQRFKMSMREVKPFVRKVSNPQRERHKNRPFAVTRKTLKKDLKILVELGWLTASEDKYHRVDRFPSIAVSDRDRLDDNTKGLTGEFVKSDLADFFNNFAQPVNNIQRFFLHLEYIIPGKLYSHIETLQKQLKTIWSQTPVPLIRLTYRSAKLYQDEIDCLVYPVCICYYQRAPYLFAYGQLPKDQTKIGWYDYRLDRILSIQEILWNRKSIPTELKPFKTTPKLPEDVFERMNEALGFEFYKPIREMLVWFEPYFYANYIEGTERAAMFKKLSSQQALKWVKKEATRFQLNYPELQSILQSRPPADEYYLVKYRVDDNNVIMRLRAWGSHVEVLFPSDLREKMRSDLEKLWKKYSN
jgi:CRISPR-associated protein (TIGR03985 family)